jgi:hypothetical protein
MQINKQTVRAHLKHAYDFRQSSFFVATSNPALLMRRIVTYTLFPGP